MKFIQLICIVTYSMLPAPDLMAQPKPERVDQAQSRTVRPFPGVATPGNSAVVAGVTAGIAAKWESSAFPAEGEGGIWPTNSYFAWAFNKEFNRTNTIGAESTAFSLMTVANDNGSPSNVVALGANTVLRSDNSAGFAGNYIVRTKNGVTNPKMVGVEIDIEPAEGVIPAPSSIALPINMFNSRNPGPAIQTGGINGGTFANGVILYGIAPTGAGFAAGKAAKMNALVNSSGCDCGNAAFVHGTGMGQGDAYGARGKGVSPYVYGDEANNLVVRLGASGGVIVYNSDGSTPVLQISSDGDVSVDGHPGASCSGPPSRSFRSIKGIVVHC